MKNILLFGAGKSATVLIDYLLSNAEKEDWQLTVVDADINLAQSKIGISPFGKAVSFDINDETDRKKFISECEYCYFTSPSHSSYCRCKKLY